MRAALELAHHHPGRLRVRSDALADVRDEEARVARAARVARVEEALRAIRGVRSIVHNAGSGSVLVEYTPGEVEPDALVDVIARAADLDPPLPEAERAARRRKPAVVAIGVTRELNEAVADLTGGRADLRSLVPLAMLGTAVFSFATKKDRLPRWDNLAYWAVSLFQALHSEEIARSRPPAEPAERGASGS